MTNFNFMIKIATMVHVTIESQRTMAHERDVMYLSYIYWKRCHYVALGDR